MTEKGTGLLADKVAIVTGSARNIGKATAERLAGDGAAVVINGAQDKAAAEEVAGGIEAGGGRAIAHIADITDPDAVRGLVEAAVAAFGGVDILVCNASIRGQKPFLEMTYEEWRGVIDVTLDGAFHTAKACVPHMVERGWGRIVTIGGISWHVGTSNRVHNLVSKSGLTGFTRGLAVELGQHNITVNSVSPGFIDTVRPGSAGVRPPLKVYPPVDRMGAVDEIASMVRYLCLPEAAYVTGQIMHVNGGMFLGG
jgi:3-oxoacyl-[acyl-carrier protein] reductase